MKIRDVRVRRVGAGEDGAAWARRLSDQSWCDGARVLKQEAGSWVRAARFEVGATAMTCIIKCRTADSMEERFKRVVGSTRGDRHWRGAEWLLAHYFPTARPLVLADAVVDDVGCEILVTEFLNARTVLDHLAAGDLSVREQHRVCRALGQLLGGLLFYERYNRDGKPSNLLVVTGERGHPEIATIDTVAIRPAARRSIARAADMLASLVIEPIGTGNEPRRTLKARVIVELARHLHAPESIPREELKRTARQLWSGAMEVVRTHGDPRPRVNPLGQAQEKTHAP